VARRTQAGCICLEAEQRFVAFLVFTDCAIGRVKTKWGSCNPTTNRLWFNLDLSKKPAMCLEYLVVHELVLLLERSHTDRFTALMNGFLPNWSVCRATLNSGVLGYEVWAY